MRLIFVVLMLTFSVLVKAQNPLEGDYINHLQPQSFANNTRSKDSTLNKKWSVNKYIGLFSSFGFFNGGNATVLAVPISLQLQRRLNNNWYAFAGASIAPAYTSFKKSFLSVNYNKFPQNIIFFTSNRFDIYPRAELGLMYVNDQKTFSISGSIGVERNSYPLIPYNQNSSVRSNTFITPNK